MTDDNTSEPLDGEIIPPGEGNKPPVRKTGHGGRPRGKGKKPGDDKAKKPVTGRGFGRQQTEEERKEEEKRSESFPIVILRGEGWWNYEGWQPTDNDKLMVQMLKFSGYSDEDIAGALHMSVETLIKYFDWELKHAKMMIMGDLATRAYTRARQGNDIMTMFLMKTRSDGAFSEKTSQAVALGESLKDADNLSDDKKAQLVASVLELLNPRKTAGAAATKEGTKQ